MPRTGSLDATRTARGLAYALMGLCLLAAAAAQLWFLRTDQPVAMDEGYMGALALRLVDGNLLPGVDGVGQRGPVLYWLVTLAQVLLGRYHWWGFRVLAWIAASVVVLSLLTLSVLARKPFAGAIGASFYVYTMFHVYALGAGMAVGGEQIAVPWICSATALTGLALASSDARRRTLLFIAGGVLAGLAGWTKVTLTFGIAPLALWVLADALRARERVWRTTVIAVLSLVGGWLLPTLAIALLYAASGHFGDLIYRFFVYNREVHMGAYEGVDMLPLVAHWFGGDPWTAYSWLGCAVALLAHLGYRAGARRGRGIVSTVASFDLSTVVLLHAMVGFAAGMMQMRFWPHHFIAALPWVGLAIGLACEWLASGWHPRVRAGLAIVALLAVGSGLAWTIGRDLHARESERKLGGWRPAREERLCREIQRLSRPNDYIFVWGFDGDLYVSCQRRPASRFVYTTLVAGIVPPFWEQARPDRIARGAVTQTLADLRRTKPTLIVSVSSDWAGRTPVTAIPELDALLQKDYCKLKGVGGKQGRRARIYAPKGSAHCGSELPSSE